MWNRSTGFRVYDSSGGFQGTAHSVIFVSRENAEPTPVDDKSARAELRQYARRLSDRQAYYLGQGIGDNAASGDNRYAEPPIDAAISTRVDQRIINGIDLLTGAETAARTRHR